MNLRDLVFYAVMAALLGGLLISLAYVYSLNQLTFETLGIGTTAEIVSAVALVLILLIGEDSLQRFLADRNQASESGRHSPSRTLVQS